MIPWLWLAAVVATGDSVRSFQVVVAPGESLHVAVFGRGEPVVLIPGFFGSVFGFRKLIPLLEEAGYQPTVVEPLGTGFSGRPPRGDYSLSAQADQIAAALDSLHIRNAPVIAHSVGGAMGLRLAYLRPDLVRLLLSLEGGPTERVATPEFKKAARYIPWIKILGGIKVIRRVVRRTLVRSSGDTTWITDGVVYGYTAGAARDLNGTLLSYLAMADSREREHLEPHLKTIRCPVRLVLGGARHDGGVGPEEVTELRRELPQFAVDSVPGAGHYLQEEQPAAILAILKRVAAAAGPGSDAGR
ncbi:MAG TPA: alpha/beta hydrolase [Gemmatimonadales bacterium]|nr:alpha/beta hydrolase [Gemmatimonadales bacterium]